MNLVNEQVEHKHFGKGSVVENTDFYVEVHFPMGNKKFVFPDAFEKYLTLIDKKAAGLVDEILQEKQMKRRQKELELEKERALQEEENQHRLEIEKHMKNFKIHTKSQAAFWCKVEDEDRIFTEWKVFTGVVKSGSNQGKPKKPTRMHQNSACLLTSREPNMQEKDRRILGIYMIKEGFIGKLCEDGYIPAHSEYRLRLSEEESEKMLFWNYYINEAYPNNTTWNTGKYRYFDNIWMAQILKDILFLKKNTEDEEFVRNFFEYFCKMNNIDAKELSKPNGALMAI